MKAQFYAALTAVFGLLAVLPVKAHHSLFAEFDHKQTVTLKGVISTIEWINPHIYVYVDVTNQEGGGVTTWAIETYPPNHMRSRYGLTKAALASGVVAKQIVTIEVNPASNGKKLGWLKQITYPDGHFIRIEVDPDSTEAR